MPLGAEHLVLDSDRPQVARAHPDERHPLGWFIGGFDLKTVSRAAHGPHLLAWRMQVLLPRLRASRMAEGRAIRPLPDPVATGLKLNTPAERQVVSRLQLIEDDRAVPDYGTDYPISGILQGRMQPGQGSGLHQQRGPRPASFLHRSAPCLPGAIPAPGARTMMATVPPWSVGTKDSD